MEVPAFQWQPRALHATPASCLTQQGLLSRAAVPAPAKQCLPRSSHYASLPCSAHCSGELEAEVAEGDRVTFISTLHGG